MFFRHFAFILKENTLDGFYKQIFHYNDKGNAPAPMLTSEFLLNLKAHQPHLISLVLAKKSQCQTALPASKAIAQTEPEGNKTEPVEKLLKSNSFAGLPLTWKSQGI